MNRTVKPRGWEEQSSQVGDKDIRPLPVALFRLLFFTNVLQAKTKQAGKKPWDLKGFKSLWIFKEIPEKNWKDGGGEAESEHTFHFKPSRLKMRLLLNWG